MTCVESSDSLRLSSYAGVGGWSVCVGRERLNQEYPRNWQNAINQIEKAISGLPKTDERRASYADAATHFMHVKDAWRNRTMHIGPIYTEEKAQRIFDNAKDFMQVLATRLSEKTPS